MNYYVMTKIFPWSAEGLRAAEEHAMALALALKKDVWIYVGTEGVKTTRAVVSSDGYIQAAY